MRHDVFRVLAIIMAITSVNTASSSSNLFPNNAVVSNSLEFHLPVGYLESNFLESSPIESQHLELYDKQDAEMSVNSDTISNKINSEIRKEENINSTLSYDQRVKYSVPNHQFVEDIFIVSEEYNIDPLLLHAIAEAESSFNAKAVSKAGAQGLMQVMPDTARRFGMQNPDYELFNPISNLRVSSNYIRALHKLFGNNIPLILAAYNAGENAVIRCGYNIPPYKETENYVDKVMKRYLELKEKSYQL
ncbi:MAG: lytic transglycosylase domain-containing protein [Candidatus Thiodiazotropha sp. LLP2]